MSYRIKYLNTATGAIYYRTLYADNLSHASSEAKKWQRKGFIWAAITPTYH